MQQILSNRAATAVLTSWKQVIGVVLQAVLTRVEREGLRKKEAERQEMS
jgi:hypothetical protein